MLEKKARSMYVLSATYIHHARLIHEETVVNVIIEHRGVKVCYFKNIITKIYIQTKQPQKY